MPVHCCAGGPLAAQRHRRRAASIPLWGFRIDISVAKIASTRYRSSGNRNRLRERWAQRGFSPADLLNLWKPNGAWEQHGGLAYGRKPRQKLDVYKPRHAIKAPVLVFFYGGSW